MNEAQIARAAMPGSGRRFASGSPAIHRLGAMLRRQPVSAALAGVLALGLTLFLAGLFLAVQIDAQVRDRQALMARIVTFDKKIGLVSDLYTTLGYDHFIHAFKNGVLRADGAQVARAEAELTTALRLTERLSGLDPTLGRELTAIRATLLAYRSKTALAQRLIAAGAGAEAIDRQVRIDDAEAAMALGRMRASLVSQRDDLLARVKEQIDAIHRQTDGLVFAVAAMAVVALLVSWLLYLAHRQAIQLTRAVGRLAALDAQLNAALSSTARAPAAGAGTGPAREPAVEVAAPAIAQDLARSIDAIVARLERQQRDLAARTEKLAKTNEELDRFAFVASHDLQEPLRKIETNIDLIRLRHADELSEGMARRLARVAKSAADMRQLIEDLLWFSRSASRPLRLKRHGLDRIVRQALSETADRFAARRGTVQTDIPAGLEIAADHSMLVQAFINLLSNAAKYSQVDIPPRARIVASCKDGMVTVQVADNGIGFDAAFAEQIFEPFQRLHGRSAYEGNGIGLSIVRRVVERHNGTVTAAPGCEGGAVFTIELPAEAGHLPPEATPEEDDRDGATPHYPDG